jgi:hypothetical protein
MKRVGSFSNILGLVGALALALGTAACGDDDGDDDVIDAGDDDDDNPDAMGDDDEPDAGDDDPDGGGGATRAGTIAVLDLAAPEVASSGAVVSITYTDLTSPGVEPVFDNVTGFPPTGCTVTVYDLKAGEAPRPRVGEGTVTISGDGLQSPVGPCNFSDTTGSYLCIARAAAAEVGDTITPGGGGAAVTIAGGNFSDDDLGSWISLSGFTNETNNGVFVIGMVLGPTTVTIGNAAAVTETVAEPGPAFAVVNGAGPTPLGIDFLNDNGEDVAISAEAGPVVGQFSIDMPAAGEGYTLDDASSDPGDIPTDGSEVTFSCEGKGGDCGTAPVGILLTVIAGEATDGPTDGYPFFVLPPAVSQAASFQCTFPAGTATIPAEAMDAILSINPTRIETRVLRVNGNVSGDGTNNVNVVIGHGIVGWTDVAAK